MGVVRAVWTNDRAAASLGISVVEQHVRQALRFADRVYVLQRGRLALSGPVAEVRDQLDEIEAAYLAR